jgi:hypothetical protein
MIVPIQFEPKYSDVMTPVGGWFHTQGTPKKRRSIDALHQISLGLIESSPDLGLYAQPDPDMRTATIHEFMNIVGEDNSPVATAFAMSNSLGALISVPQYRAPQMCAANDYGGA